MDAHPAGAAATAGRGVPDPRHRRRRSLPALRRGDDLDEGLVALPGVPLQGGVLLTARIAVLGDRNPAYLTHRELDAALELFGDGADARWLATDDPAVARIGEFDAVWVVPGTPYVDGEAAL